MEDEKKITAPKRKKTVSTSKKSSRTENQIADNADDILELDEFKIDLVSEIKPVRKAGTAGKKATATPKKSSSSAESKKSEAAKIADAYEATPRKRKTAKADSPTKTKTPSKRNSKSTKIEAIEKIAASNFEEIIELPQTEASVRPEKTSISETHIVESEKVATDENETKDPLAGKSPVFRELAAPKLPDLQPENRAWMQIQSPTRIFFYWSLKANPFETLQKVFGGRNGNYALSVKLQNLTNETEKIYPLAPYGSAWFDVESNATYRAEVGFYDARKPFIRLVFSNTLETPRLSPSPRTDWSPEFATTSREFAEVLDVSGYKQDAFEMALAGDDLENANVATFDAFEQITGDEAFEIDPAELRLVLFALASGLSLADLRGQISPQIFAYLEKLMRENPESLAAEKILAALQEHFGLGTLETEDEAEEVTYSVFGASRINFQKLPKQFWKKLSPISSQRISS